MQQLTSSSRVVAAQDPVAALWKSYRQKPSDTLRNRLIEHYLPLVQTTAKRLEAKLRRVVYADELLAAGILGLVDAIDSFDVGRKVKFSTFSAIRIRGAMLDELRSMDPAPRRVRNRARKLEAAAQQLQAELGRPPADDELAAHLNLVPEMFRAWCRDARLAGMRPLETPTRQRDQRDPTGTTLPADPRSVDPSREAQKRALREMMLRGLSRAERLIFTLYYYEDLTMREIGQVLDLSESRVSQMHTSICRRLHAAARSDRPEIPDELAA